MTRTALLLLCAASLLSAGTGVPARPAPSDYPAHVSGKSATVAADWMGADQVKGAFSTDLTEYAVIEVAVYPKDGKPIDISALDFALKGDGRMIRPVDPRTIANIRHRRASKKRNDVALYPTVGLTTGTWGTGVGVGVGVGRGGYPGPASSPRDRDVMEQELEDKGLKEGQTAKSVGGFLYFPVEKKKAANYELEFVSGDTEVRMKVTETK